MALDEHENKERFRFILHRNYSKLYSHQLFAARS